MKRTPLTRKILPAAGVLLLGAMPIACSHAPSKAAASVEAAALAREHAMQQAKAAAGVRDADRQELASIPLPSKNIYAAIHTRQSWQNPFLVVGKAMVTLSMLYPDMGPDNSPGAAFLRPTAARRRVVELRPPDLPEALTALPANTWPYGRVIAVEEDPLETRQDQAQVRRNVEATEQTLSDLGVVAYDWPTNGPR